jgi:hypothetical protein
MLKIQPLGGLFVKNKMYQWKWYGFQIITPRENSLHVCIPLRNFNDLGDTLLINGTAMGTIE